MFLTGLAPNLLALELVSKIAKVSVTWREWFLGFLPVGGLLLIFLPYLVYKIYPPEIKSSENVPVWARDELSKMGKITRNELTMATLVIIALVLWIFGGSWFDATTVALMVLSLMILMGIIKWSDILNHKQAWNILVWFATLVTLADGLRLVGFLNWFSAITAGAMKGIPVMWMVVLFVAIFFIVHYMFASLTAHTAALLPVFLVTAMAVPGMPIKLLAMLLCYTLGLMGILTPYATGPSPIYYGSGYVAPKDFWTLGLIFGLIFLVVFLIVGVPYMRWYIS
jgi:L-tartrate/succinate antiporter